MSGEPSIEQNENVTSSTFLNNFPRLSLLMASSNGPPQLQRRSPSTASQRAHSTTFPSSSQSACSPVWTIGLLCILLGVVYVLSVMSRAETETDTQATNGGKTRGSKLKGGKHSALTQHGSQHSSHHSSHQSTESAEGNASFVGTVLLNINGTMTSVPGWTKRHLFYCLKRLSEIHSIVPECDVTWLKFQKERPQDETDKERNLMIIAHPDDETIFGGRELLSNDRWIILCVTCRDVGRFADLKRTANYVGAQVMKLGLEDIEYGPLKGRVKFVATIQMLLKDYHFNKIVTHNPRGEYGHTAHKQIFQWTAETLKSVPFYVFTARKDAVLPVQLRPHLFKLFAMHPSQWRVIGGFMNASIHQAIRLCRVRPLRSIGGPPPPEEGSSAGGGPYTCLQDNPKLEAEENALQRPFRVVKAIAERHNYLKLRAQGLSREQAMKHCAKDRWKCTREPPSKWRW